MKVGVFRSTLNFCGETKLIAVAIAKRISACMLTVPQYWGLLPSLNISAPLGCLICADHLASTADIVAGDVWYPKFVGKNSSGVSILIVRTSKGLELVNSAIKDGALYAEEARLLDLVIAQGHDIIEGSQYAPFRQKLLQHRTAAIRELNEVDKTIIALLAIVNRYMSKCYAIRRLFSTPLAEKLLNITLWLLSRHESMRLLEAIDTSGEQNLKKP